MRKSFQIVFPRICMRASCAWLFMALAIVVSYQLGEQRALSEMVECESYYASFIHVDANNFSEISTAILFQDGTYLANPEAVVDSSTCEGRFHASLTSRGRRLNDDSETKSIKISNLKQQKWHYSPSYAPPISCMCTEPIKFTTDTNDNDDPVATVPHGTHCNSGSNGQRGANIPNGASMQNMYEYLFCEAYSIRGPKGYKWKLSEGEKYVTSVLSSTPS